MGQPTDPNRFRRPTIQTDPNTQAVDAPTKHDLSVTALAEP